MESKSALGVQSSKKKVMIKEPLAGRALNKKSTSQLSLGVTQKIDGSVERL